MTILGMVVFREHKEVRIGSVNKTGLDDAGPVLTFGEMADGHLMRMVDGKDLRPIPFSGVDISQPDEVEKTRRRRRGCAKGQGSNRRLRYGKALSL